MGVVRHPMWTKNPNNMKTWTFLFIFGVFLLSASFVRGEDEPVDVDQEQDTDAEQADAGQADKESNDLDVEEENDVLVLTEKNFDAVIESHDIILVEFYAPWCGHCKNLAPEFEKAAKTLKQNDPPVALAKVDATVESGLGGRYDVTGYPTLKFFKKGQVNNYEGPRDELGIVSYMQEKSDPNWKPPPSEVADLTKDNFEEFINSNELSLVEFYAPWCGHCKRLAPEFEKAAQALKGDIPLGKVDATVESDIAQQFKIQGYPTLKVFRNGKDYEYKGEQKSANDLMQYMSRQKGSASKEQSTLKALQKAFSVTDVTVVGFFDSEKDKEYAVYDEFANSVRDEYILLHTFDKGIRDNYKVNAGTVVVFNAERFQSKYEPKWYIFDVKADTETDDIDKFVSDHELPLTGQLTANNKNERYMVEGHKPLVMFFYDVDWSFDYRVATEKNRQRVLKIANDYKDLTFLVTDEKESSDLFKNFGFEDSGEDLNIGVLSSGGGKYPMEPMEDGFDSDAIREFLDKFKSGKLKPKLKSQKPPKKQGAVTVVVGDTFEKIVLDKKKDVLIEFYAPWCGHCKKLDPKYKELAKKFKKEKNLVIAKMDATANEAPEQFAVEGFPTIYFATANHKSDPIQYSGSNEVDDLTEFIKKNSAASFRDVNKDEL